VTDVSQPTHICVASEVVWMTYEKYPGCHFAINSSKYDFTAKKFLSEKSRQQFLQTVIFP